MAIRTHDFSSAILKDQTKMRKWESCIASCDRRHQWQRNQGYIREKKMSHVNPRVHLIWKGKANQVQKVCEEHEHS
jgi:hypothetical protein